jgi:hypothetical protein
MLLNPQHNMSWHKKLKFWKRRADPQTLWTNLEERNGNQEQSDAILQGRFTALEEHDIERQQVEASVREADKELLNPQHNMSWFKKLEFWKRRADSQQLWKNLEERNGNQEQSDAILQGRFTTLEEHDIEKQRVEARLRETNKELLNTQHNMSWCKKLKFWKRRADSQRLWKNLEKRNGNQEQSDAILQGRFTASKEHDIERQQFEARLRETNKELQEENANREHVEDEIFIDDEYFEERSDSEQVDFQLSSHFEGLKCLLNQLNVFTRNGTDAETNKELEQEEQESNANCEHVEDEIFIDKLEELSDSEQMDFGLSGHFERFNCFVNQLTGRMRNANWEHVEDEIFIDDEYFEEPMRRERKMESEFENIFHDEKKELKSKFERIPRYAAYIRIPFLRVFSKEYKGTRIPWKYLGFLGSIFAGFVAEDYEVATATG